MAGRKEIKWSDEAVRMLCKAPAFLHESIRAMALARAKEAGLDEVTPELLSSIKEEAAGRFGVRTSTQGPAQTKKLAAEEVGRVGENSIAIGDASGQPASGTSQDHGGHHGVSWSDEAWARLQKAPAFVRAGIVKLAEAKAAERGLKCVTSELLTELRDGAMMKAVRMIKALGCSELSPEAFDMAKKKMKKFGKDPEAQKALNAVKEYIEKRGKVGLIDEEMLKKMKDYLKKSPEKEGPAS